MQRANVLYFMCAKSYWKSIIIFDFKHIQKGRRRNTYTLEVLAPRTRPGTLLVFFAPTIYCVGGGKLKSVLRFFPNSAKSSLFILFYILFCVLLRRGQRFANKRSHLCQHAILELSTLYPKLIVFYYGESRGSKQLRYFRILTYPE